MSAGGFDLTGTVRSLLNIEVNTIIADTMSAEPMPPLPHALLDIADWYAEYLCRMGLDLVPFLCGPADGTELRATPVRWTSPGSFPSGELKVDAATFERLRCAADAAGQDPAIRSSPEKSVERVMLYRIVKNCDAIKGMFERFRPEPTAPTAGGSYRNAIRTMFQRFDRNTTEPRFWGQNRTEVSTEAVDRGSYSIQPDDLVTLQKIWDLGTQEVVAQTVVFLNGNVTTRVQKRLGTPPDNALFGIHRQSVDVSVGCWHYLLQALREIAGTALSTLFNPRQRP